MPTPPRSQANRPFRTPPRWLVPWITRVQVFLYERSRGRFGATAAGMSNLLLRSVGRKSGNPNVACLPYWLDAQDQRIVVASHGGAPRNPAWYHNATDRSANPEVVVRDRQRVFWARVEVLEGEEREAIWKAMTADRPYYVDYQAQTRRVIPILRIVETRPYGD